MNFGITILYLISTLEKAIISLAFTLSILKIYNSSPFYIFYFMSTLKRSQKLCPKCGEKNYLWDLFQQSHKNPLLN